MTDSKIGKAILKSRNIKDTSLKLYLNNLKKLNLLYSGIKEIPDNTKFLKDFKKISELIDKEEKITTRKNLLTAALVGLSSDTKLDNDMIEKYQDKLKYLTNQYNDTQMLQKKTKTQEENWLEFSDLIKISNELFDDIKTDGLMSKKELTNKEYNTIQKFVLLSLYIHHPMRNDIADMKVLTKEEYDKLPKNIQCSNNFFVNQSKKVKRIILNQFKTRDKLGCIEIPLGSKMCNIINNWLKVNNSGWLFTKSDRITPISPNGVTKLFNNIFHYKADGKKISSSMIRHIVISHDLKDTLTLADEKDKSDKIKTKYQHSKEMNQLYRKVD